MTNQTKFLIWVMFLGKPINGERDSKNGHSVAKVSLKKTGSNQDFEFRCLGGKYQDLFFQSGVRDTADFFKQNKQ